MTDTPRFDLPPDRFPFTMEFVALDGEVVHTITVTGEQRLFIPALAKEHGPVGVRITFANGEVNYTPRADVSKRKPTRAELELALTRTVGRRLKDVPRNETIRAQAVADQLAAQLTDEFTWRGVKPPTPIRITITGPGRFHIGFEEPE